MKRHHRSNSDLEGLKAFKNLKRTIQTEKQTVGRFNRTFSTVQSPTPTNSKVRSCPETPTKKYEPNELIKNTIKLAKHFYRDDEVGYLEKMSKYLKQDSSASKKLFIDHLDKITYIEKEMHKKTFIEIEETIVQEWRKNKILFNIRAIWYDIILKLKFSTIADFIKHYNTFKDFIGQVAYLYFRGFFCILEMKGNEDLLDRLTERTAHFIISNSSNWSRIYEKMLMDLFRKSLFPKKEDQSSLSLSAFDISSLKVSEYAYNANATEIQFPQTIETINQFILENKLLPKMHLLATIREVLELQIKNWQDILIEEGKIKKYQVLDKDDFIGCFIYCVIRGEIDFERFGLSIKCFSFILGTDFSEILSKYGNDSYLADLEMAFDYLNLWLSQKETGEAVEQFKSLTDFDINSNIKSDHS